MPVISAFNNDANSNNDAAINSVFEPPNIISPHLTKRTFVHLFDVAFISNFFIALPS